MSPGSVSAAFSRGFAGVRRVGQEEDGLSRDVGSYQGQEHPLPMPQPQAVVSQRGCCRMAQPFSLWKSKSFTLEWSPWLHHACGQ